MSAPQKLSVAYYQKSVGGVPIGPDPEIGAAGGEEEIEPFFHFFLEWEGDRDDSKIPETINAPDGSEASLIHVSDFSGLEQLIDSMWVTDMTALLRGGVMTIGRGGEVGFRAIKGKTYDKLLRICLPAWAATGGSKKEWDSMSELFKGIIRKGWEIEHQEEVDRQYSLCRKIDREIVEPLEAKKRDVLRRMAYAAPGDPALADLRAQAAAIDAEISRHMRRH